MMCIREVASRHRGQHLLQRDTGTTDTGFSVMKILGEDDMILPADTAHPAPLVRRLHEQEKAYVAVDLSRLR